MKNPLAIISFFVVHILLVLPLYSQKEATHWFFGDGQGLTFASGKLATLPKLRLTADEATVSMSHPITGQFQFYFDGTTVWSVRSNAIMKNGSNMQSGKSSSMGGLSMPFMSNPNKFFLFTVPCLTGFDNLRTENMVVNEIDMAADGAKGEITLKNKVLHKFTNEKITGTLTCDGKGYWIIVHDKEDAVFYAYKINNDVLDPNPVISRVGNVPKGHDRVTSILGQMKMSPDGSKLAMSDGDRGVELYRFNKKTGAITDPITIPAPLSPNNSTIYPLMYSVSFSPNSRLLYIFGESTRSRVYRIYQYDVSRYSRTLILGSQYVTADLSKGDLLISALSLAPDGKLYFHTTTDSIDPNTKDALRFLHSIDKPNVKGSGCKLNWRVLRISPYTCLGLPNYMDYLFASDSLSINCTKPRPKFAFTPDSVCLGGMIRIFDMTENAQDWVWKFPGGKPSEWYEKSPPMIRYDTAGNYEITLTAHNSNGDSTIVKKIHVFEAPYVDAGRDKYTCGATVVIGTPAENGYTYAWSPKQGLNDSTLAMPTVSIGTKVQKYIVTVTDPRGCTARDTVLVGPMNGTLADRVVQVCRGFSAQVTIEGEGTITWKPTDGVSNPNSFNPILSPIQTMVYEVVVQSGLCKDTVLITLKINELPVADAGPDRSVCGNSVSIGSSILAGYSYLWSPGKGLSDSTFASPVVTTTENMRYVLTITSPEGCRDTDTVDVSISDFGIVVSNDTTMCIGGTAFLTARGATDYEWSPAVGLNSTTVANPRAKPLVTTRYKVIGKSGVCTDSAYITVTVQPPPKANAGEDISLCGNSGTIGAPSEKGLTYTWLPTKGLNDATNAMPTVMTEVNTKYILKVTNQLGCFSFDTVLVKVGSLTAEISNDTSICAGNWAQLIASGGTEYNWKPVTGLDNPKSATPRAMPQTTTTYTVTVSSGICRDSAVVTVAVVPQPTVDAGKDAEICTSGEVTIGADAVLNTSYEWKDKGGNIIGSTPRINVKPNLTSYYVLTASNSLGCSVHDTVYIKVMAYPVLTTSPDEDICRGDTITLEANGAMRYEWSWNGSVFSDKKITIVPQNTGMCTVIGYNELGCADTAVVHFTVRQTITRMFTLLCLSPASKEFNIGENIPTRITIPKGITEFALTILHEKGTFVPQLTMTSTLGNTWVINKDINEEFVKIRGIGNDTLGGYIEYSYVMFLPSKWTEEKHFTMSVDEVKPIVCAEYRMEDTKVRLSTYCANGFRGVVGSNTPFSLQSIYPNPVNDNNISIEYSIGLEIGVGISILNAMGEEVYKTPMNMQKEGYYTLDADIDTLSAGIYFVRMKTPIYNQTIQFIKE